MYLTSMWSCTVYVLFEIINTECSHFLLSRSGTLSLRCTSYFLLFSRVSKTPATISVQLDRTSQDQTLFHDACKRLVVIFFEFILQTTKA